MYQLEVSEEQMEGYMNILPHCESIQERVVYLFTRYGPMSDHILYAKYLEVYNPPITPTLFRTVGARRYELVKANRVERVGSIENPTSGIQNALWGLKNVKGGSGSSKQSARA